MQTGLVHFSTADAAFANVAVKRDGAGRLSLTDLWIAAGRPKDKRPVDWREMDTTPGFMLAVSKYEKVPQEHLLEVSRGRTGGTYGHRQLALEYAQYLNAELAVAVNATFFERIEEERNPDKALDRTVSIYQRRGFTPEKIAERLSGKAARLIFTSTLAKHGVGGFKGAGFALCTRAVYKPLFGGDGSSAAVLTKLSAPANASPRDHMNPMMLAAVRFTELAAAEAIEANNVRGNAPCAAVCEAAGRQVAAVVRSARKKFAA